LPASGHARVKRRGVAPDEYDSCRAAWRSFPDYAPEPLGQYFAGEWEIIVLRGIEHDYLSVGDIGRDRQQLVGKLSTYFDASRQAQLAPGVPHREFLRGVRERTTDANAAAVLDQWILNRELDQLPFIAQHGDFTVNNLALSKGRLVIFDWEDFGSVCLPGLDLCTAIASDARLDALRLGAVTRGAYARLVDNSCPPLGLTPKLFLRLIPLYLTVFLDLKRGYAETIRHSIRQLIQGATAPQ